MTQKIVSPHVWQRVLLVLSLALCGVPAVYAQDAGGDLGGSLGVFRPKNPTTNRPKPKPAPLRPTPANNRAAPERNKPAVAAAPVKKGPTLNERIEDALDAGNEARDARRFVAAEKSYRAALGLKAREWRAAYGLGNLYTDQQLWDEAEKAYRQAAAFNTKNADILVALSYVLLQPRASGNNAKLLSEAEQAARRALLIDKKNAQAFDRLGVALEERGVLTEETEQAYRSALAIEPDFAVAYVHLARFLTKKGRAAEATPLYGKATQLAQDEDTLVLVASALQSQQLWSESEPVLLRALEKDAKHPGALLYLARVQAVSQRYDEAETTLKKLITVTPRNFAAHYTLGSVYLRANRLGEAEESFQKAAGFASEGQKRILAGNFGLSGLGDAYERAGRYQDAVRLYERALTLDPDNQSLSEKITKARQKASS